MPEHGARQQAARGFAAVLGVPVRRAVDLEQGKRVARDASLDERRGGGSRDLRDCCQPVGQLAGQPTRHGGAVGHADDVDPARIDRRPGSHVVDHRGEITDLVGLRVSDAPAIVPDLVHGTGQRDQEAHLVRQAPKAGQAVEQLGADAAAVELEQQRNPLARHARRDMEQVRALDRGVTQPDGAGPGRESHPARPGAAGAAGMAGGTSSTRTAPVTLTSAVRPHVSRQGALASGV